MATFVPFGAAMFGAQDGPYAAVAAFGAFMVALWLQLKRPTTMPRTLARTHGIVAVGVVVDAVRTGEPLRFVGVFVCFAVAVWMTNLQPPRQGLPGPA